MAPPNPLLQYDSPRRAYNSTEYSQTQSTVTLTGKGVALTSNLLLGSGIVIEEAPAAPGTGQVPYTKLSVDPAITTALTALAARVALLESVLEVEAQQVVLKNPQGNIMIILGQDNGDPAWSFFGGPLSQKQGVSLGSGTLAADTASAIASYGFISAGP